MASGAYDVAMALGVEKTKDSGYQGLNAFPPPNDGTGRTLTAAAMFSMVAPAYAHRYGVDEATMSRGDGPHRAEEPRQRGPQPAGPVPQRGLARDDRQGAARSPGRSACSTAPGSPTAPPRAIVCRAEDAHRYTDKPLYVKALSFVAGNGSGLTDPAYDYTTFPEIVACAADAYAQAGINDPAAELAMAEVHDCFTITELVLMEDLGFCERGTAWHDVLDGRFDLDGELPVNPDGGLKSFGHPVGASGLRMMFEAWLQLRGEAGDERQVDLATGARRALTHNLGGYPGEMVSFVSILGTELG